MLALLSWVAIGAGNCRKPQHALSVLGLTVRALQMPEKALLEALRLSAPS
jgi:hypothetical protein